MGKYIFILTVFLTGTLAGLHTGSALFFNPAVDALPPLAQITALKEMEKVFNPAVPILMIAMGISCVILPFFVKKHPFLFKCSIIAALCIAIQTITTLTINVPINNDVAAIDLTQIPTDWEATRARWNTFNQIRTLLLNTAFLTYLFGLVSLFSSHNKK